jgi:hypothetical protein
MLLCSALWVRTPVVARAVAHDVLGALSIRRCDVLAEVNPGDKLAHCQGQNSPRGAGQRPPRHRNPPIKMICYGKLESRGRADR